jgi:hypothetical protein
LSFESWVLRFKFVLDFTALSSRCRVEFCRLPLYILGFIIDYSPFTIHYSPAATSTFF